MRGSLLTILLAVIAAAACTYETSKPSGQLQGAWNPPPRGVTAAARPGPSLAARLAERGRAAARRLLEAPPDGGGRGRVKPVVINSCGATLRNVRVSFIAPTGRVRRARMPSIAPNARRTATLRAAWPSQGVVTGRVEGGGTFELGFEVGPDGVISWPMDVGSRGPVTPEVAVAGAACSPGGELKVGPKLEAMAAAAAQTAARAAGGGAAGAAYTVESGDGASSGADAAAAAAARAASALAAGDPPAAVAPAAVTTAVPDRASTTFNTPVDIYILRNDIIPDPANTDVFLFSSSSGRDTVQLATPSDDGGATEDAAEGTAGELWSWTYNTASFQAGSFLTYTPPSNFLGGNIVFNYTLGTSVTNVTVFVQPPDGATLQASPDTYRFTPDAEGAYTPMEVKINDSGPSGLIQDANGDLPDPNDYLTIITWTNGTKGTVELDEDGTSFTYTVTDPLFVCGIDKYYYSVTDPLWPARRPATTWVTVTVLEDPPDFESIDPAEPPLYPYAADDTFDEISRSQVFVMAGLTANDQVCGAAIGYAGSMDPVAGRVNRNGRSVVWYPPKGGIPADIDYLEFEYSLRLEFIQDGVRYAADSNRGLVTINFQTAGGEDPPPPDGGGARKRARRGIKAVGRVEKPKKPKRVPPPKTHNKLLPKKPRVSRKRKAPPRSPAPPRRP